MTAPLEAAPLYHPTTNGTWLADYGGQLMPDSRGSYSLAWMDMIKSESGEPLWPDPYQPMPQVRE